MTTVAEDLRDLARRIDLLARESPIWSSVHREVQVLCDHLSAKARISEQHNSERKP